jgi:hypothetical protein
MHSAVSHQHNSTAVVRLNPYDSDFLAL